ncbi:hypothetical protein [Sphingomicrobium arenosum]|uniref:hypothetical protein n=1 Tax=Sphingomicrobium arenosum TaxID=2233861 RepID=UPI00223F3E3F|nr:hypothetical protein [Sphingomicrobium arenosum]
MSRAPNMIRPSRARWLLLFSLLAYPLGCLLHLGVDGAPLSVLGLILIILSILALVPIARSRLQSIVMRGRRQLDEFEVAQRLRALSSAYFLLAAIIVLALAYARHADQFGLWVPRGEDEWTALFYGAVLYAFFLPTTLLAFSQRDPLGDEGDERA